MSYLNTISTLKKILSSDNQAFIHSCYRFALVRQPDIGGGQHYLTQLRKGAPKELILLDILASVESRNQWREAGHETRHKKVIVLARGLAYAAVARKLIQCRANTHKEPTPESSCGEQREPIIAPTPLDTSFTLARPQTMRNLLSLLTKWSVFKSHDEFHYLYGRFDGDDLIEDVQSNPPTTIILLCPSYGKQCGIGEYAAHLKASFEANGLTVLPIRTSNEASALSPSVLRGAVLLVNHGPGLFDGYNPQLSEGESTHALLSTLGHLQNTHGVRPIFFLHSLLDETNQIMYGRQHAILHSGFPVFTTITSAAQTFRIMQVEHGVQPISLTQPTQLSPVVTDNENTHGLKLGFFGFFQWGGKDFDALLSIARATKATLVGSVATSSPTDLDKLNSMLVEYGVHCDIGVGWVSNDELSLRLREADFYYMPQKDYDHWNNSGSARLAANFAKPILVPPHQPFLDLAPFVTFVEEHDAVRVISSMRNRQAYNTAASSIRTLVDEHPMKSTAKSLLTEIQQRYLETNIYGLLSINLFSLQRRVLSGITSDDMLLAPSCYVSCPAIKGFERHYYSRLQTDDPLKGPLFQTVLPIERWRRHYALEDFLYADTDDVVTAVYRAVFKREPSRAEFAAAGVALHKDSTDIAAHAVAEFIASVYKTASTAENLHSLPRVTIGTHGQLSSRTTHINPQDTSSVQIQFVHSLTECTKALNRLREAANQPEVFFSDGNGVPENNIFTLLVLPPRAIAAYLDAHFCLPHDVDALESMLCGLSKRDRFLTLTMLLSRNGAPMSDDFIIDEPTPHAVDHFKQLYYYEELALFDGDAFIINSYRCLAKRDPFPKEMHDGRIDLTNYGKLAYLSRLAGRPGVQAIIHGIDDREDFGDGANNLASPSFRRLIEDFRNPMAGGRVARNKYLLEKRSLSRTWLALKAGEDHYCGS